VRLWARACATFTGRKRGQRPYWEIGGVETSMVAKQGRRRCSGAPAISRRSLQWRAVRSGRGRTRRSGAQEDRKTCQGGAPVEDREDRRRGGGSGSPTMTNSSGNVRRCCGLRRWIAAVWGGTGKREEKGAREELLGFI
jgi:hypothetical protein